MLQKLKTLAAREDGFTLVELMVVVAILAVLLADGRLDLRRREVARARTPPPSRGPPRLWRPAGSCSRTMPPTPPPITATLAAAEPGLQFTDATVGSDDPNVASTDVPDARRPATPSWRRSTATAGNCFFIRDWITIGIGYAVLRDAAPSDCTAGNAALR